MEPLAALRDRLRTAAVTGTNGKTTTTAMIASIAAAAGEPAAEVTTLGARVRGGAIAYDGSMAAFEKVVRRAVGAGVRTLALEVTSRALAAGFADRWPPDVAVLTNLSHDHLDRHGSVEAYLAAKAALMLALPPGGVAVLNAADPASALIDEVLPSAIERRAFLLGDAHPDCSRLPVWLAAPIPRLGANGTDAPLEDGRLSRALGGRLRLRMLGRPPLANALAAAVAADALGYAPGDVLRGLEELPGLPGRFEIVARRPLVVVDYAHTPHALEATLASAAEIARARGGDVSLVFGCGGDRDRDKRPLMGRVADELADAVVLTSDNPRSEDPEAIADAVAAGAGGGARWSRQLDRAQAIAAAVMEAAPADVIVIAGRGHETRQIVGHTSRELDDAACARHACEAACIALDSELR